MCKSDKEDIVDGCMRGRVGMSGLSQVEQVIHHARPDATSACVLTSRERSIVPLLVHGWTDREIAGHLNLCERSVKYYISGLYRKLIAQNRANLTYILLRSDLWKPCCESAQHLQCVYNRTI